MSRNQSLVVALAFCIALIWSHLNTRGQLAKLQAAIGNLSAEQKATHQSFQQQAAVVSAGSRHLPADAVTQNIETKTLGGRVNQAVGSQTTASPAEELAPAILAAVDSAQWFLASDLWMALSRQSATAETLFEVGHFLLARLETVGSGEALDLAMNVLDDLSDRVPDLPLGVIANSRLMLETAFSRLDSRYSSLMNANFGAPDPLAELGDRITAVESTLPSAKQALRKLLIAIVENEYAALATSANVADLDFLERIALLGNRLDALQDQALALEEPLLYGQIATWLAKTESTLESSLVGADIEAIEALITTTEGYLATLVTQPPTTAEYSRLPERVSNLLTKLNLSLRWRMTKEAEEAILASKAKDKTLTPKQRCELLLPYMSRPIHPSIMREVEERWKSCLEDCSDKKVQEELQMKWILETL